MNRIQHFALLVFVLLTAASPALATGQEMAGVVAYLIVLVSLVSGLVLGALVVTIILLLSWRRGTLRRHPSRMAAISGAVMVSGPILVFLGFMLGAFAVEVMKYPAQYPGLTGAGLEPAEVPQPSDNPAATPQRDLVAATRDRMEVLVQDVVRWWYYDPDVEEAERRASEGN